MPSLLSDRVDIVLLDIEGTTTPVDYVFGVLFPFAKEQAAAYLAEYGQTEAVQADLRLLRAEYEQDVVQGGSIVWDGDRPEAAVPYIHHLIAIDRKSTGLKSLQGKIWEQGYRSGTLRSVLFPDVPPALRRWTAAGKRVYIFSSGSVQAQQLLFQFTEFGDLTPLLSGYFDTQTGPKREASSYEAIAATMPTATSQVLFISDITAELSAARSAGMQTLFSRRVGNPATDPADFPLIETFDRV